MGMMSSRPSEQVVGIAFENGIARGGFTQKGADDWMYMHSKGGNDFFKHRDTKEYIQIPNLIQLERW